MARIDIFLDLNGVLQEEVEDEKRSRAETFPIRGGVSTLNFFINNLISQGHHVTIVPVTSLRKDINADALRQLYEGIGVRKGLPFVHYEDGTRDTVVERRNDKGKNDAFVIFDDHAEFYPDKTNLVAVEQRIYQKRKGLLPMHTEKAKVLIDAQLAAAPVRNDPPPRTPKGPKGPDDVA